MIILIRCIIYLAIDSRRDIYIHALKGFVSHKETCQLACWIIHPPNSFRPSLLSLITSIAFCPTLMIGKYPYIFGSVQKVRIYVQLNNYNGPSNQSLMPLTIFS